MANTASPVHGFTITNPFGTATTTNTTTTKDSHDGIFRPTSELNIENLSLLSSSAPSSHTRRSSAWAEGLNTPLVIKGDGTSRSTSNERPRSRASIHSLPSEILHDALSHLIPPVSQAITLPAYIPALSTLTNPSAGNGDSDGTSTGNVPLSLSDPDPQTTTFLDPSPNASPADIRLRHLLAVSRVNKAFHETAKKILWEEVDVTGGRGWMSIVDALMEEVDESGEDDNGGQTAMAIDIPSSSLYIDTQPLPLPVGELAFSTATPISPTSSLISSDFAGSYIAAHSQSQIAAATCSTSPLGGGGPDQQFASMPLHHVVSLLTPVQSRLSSTSSRRRLQSRSRSTSQNTRSRSPSNKFPPPPAARPRLGSLGRQASLRGRTEDQNVARGIDAVLAADDRRSRSASSRRRVRITSTDGTRDGDDRHHSYLEEGDEDEDANEDQQRRLEEEEEEDRGRSGWSPRSMAETLFDSPHSGRAPLEEDEEELEAMHRVEEWEVSSCQWQAPPQTITPGQYIRHLSFANFRTTGTRRTQEEAVRGKFVTGGRLEGVLKNTPNLRTLGMTEYVDSSLTLPVLTELFFRGYSRPSHTFTPESSFPMRRTGDEGEIDPNDHHDAVGREPEHTLEYVPYEPETDEEQWDRREDFAPLEALDLTGCVSRVFGESLEAFVKGWLTEPPTEAGWEQEAEERGRSRVVRWDQDSDAGFNTTAGWRKPLFNNLKRLSLRACTTISEPTICTLVSSFPNLTHLDLSVTRVPSALLDALAQIPTLQLQAFSIARCTRISSAAIRDFLINAPGARTITDLNLFGDFTYSSPLTPEDLDAIVRDAPCFKNRQLRYLDISSAPVTNDLFSKAVFPPQPHLRSLGLSYIPTLDLGAVAEFLTSQAPNVEILTIASSSTLTDLPVNLTALQITMVLHSKLINPLTLPPFSLFPQPGVTAPTKLRVIELSTRIRNLLGLTGGSKDWRTIKSKGNRGWYVDISAGWTESPGGIRKFTRGLTRGHPSRQYLEQLAEYNGRVGSGVGWHSRKMEVIRGDGMMGREAGLYGAGAFAFEG